MANEKELTKKQKSFCDEYLIDFNATRAYKKIYTTCNKDETARANSSRLLTKANIQEYLKEQTNRKQEEARVTQNDIVNQLTRIAFGDIRKLYDEQGRLKDIQDIDDDTAAIISGIETTEEFEGYGDDREQIGYTKKVKMAGKEKALELLGKHFGMFKDKVEVSQDKPFEVNINIKKK